METVSIAHEFILNTTPDVVFETLVDSTKHSDLIGEDASIQRKIGGKLTAFGDWVKGEVTDLVQDEVFGFTWIPDEEGWPKEHSSQVMFEFEEQDGKTLVKFSHDNLPENIHENFEDGWKEYYFEPLQDMFNS